MKVKDKRQLGEIKKHQQTGAGGFNKYCSAMLEHRVLTDRGKGLHPDLRGSLEILMQMEAKVDGKQ